MTRRPLSSPPHSGGKRQPGCVRARRRSPFPDARAFDEPHLGGRISASSRCGRSGRTPRLVLVPFVARSVLAALPADARVADSPPFPPALQKGFTPLHVAAKYGSLDVAKLLLQRRAAADAAGKVRGPGGLRAVTCARGPGGAQPCPRWGGGLPATPTGRPGALVTCPRARVGPAPLPGLAAS